MRSVQVVPYRVWVANDGRRASTGGALPWRTPQERDRDGWRCVDDGYTVRWADGTTGGMPGGPWRTAAEAEAAIASREPFTAEGLHAALARLEAAGIEARWIVQPAPGGGFRPFIVVDEPYDVVGTPLELELLLAKEAAHA